MSIFESGLITPDDLLQIENVLYTPFEDEMIARKMFNVNSSWASYAREIGYDYATKTGSAKILASGGGAKDVPFVGEEGNRVTQSVYTIVSGVRFTKADIAAIQAKRALGKGPAIQLDTTRVSTARQYIFEEENRIAFVGDSAHGIIGIFDDTFYTAGLGTKELIAQGAFSGTAAQKRLWENKTSREILTDLEIGMNVVESTGVFKAKVLALAPSQYNRLRRPFSDTGDSRTLLTWLRSEGMFFEQIIVSRQFLAANNGDVSSLNTFMILDNRPEVVELSLINDIGLGAPTIDLVGTQEMAVMLDTAGIIVRHPSALYIGRGC